MNQNVEKRGLAKGGFILGIIAIALAFIPVLNNISIILGIIGGIMALIATIKNNSKGMAIIGLILSILAVIVSVSLQNTWVEELDNLSKEIEEIGADKTDGYINNIDLTIGEFTIKKDEYGIENTSLPIVVKNKLEESKSFTVTIEVVDKDGKRLGEDTAYFNSLNPGQEQEQKLFEYVESEKIEAYKNAEFKLLELEQY